MGRCGGRIFALDPGAAFGSLQQGSDGLILQFSQIQMGRPLREVKDLDTDHLIVLIEVEHHAGRDFFGFNDRGVIQPQIKRVRFLINV